LEGRGAGLLRAIAGFALGLATFCYADSLDRLSPYARDVLLIDHDDHGGGGSHPGINDRISAFILPIISAGFQQSARSRLVITLA